MKRRDLKYSKAQRLPTLLEKRVFDHIDVIQDEIRRRQDQWMCDKLGAEIEADGDGMERISRDRQDSLQSDDENDLIKCATRDNPEDDRASAVAMADWHVRGKVENAVKMNVGQLCATCSDIDTNNESHAERTFVDLQAEPGQVQ